MLTKYEVQILLAKGTWGRYTVCDWLSDAYDAYNKAVARGSTMRIVDYYTGKLIK